MIKQAQACAYASDPEKYLRFFLWPIETYAPVFKPAGENVSSIAQYLADNFVVGTTQNMSQLFTLLSRLLYSDARATAECTEPYFDYNPAAANRHGVPHPSVDCMRDELPYQTISELTIQMSTDFQIYWAAKSIFEKQLTGATPLPVHDITAIRRSCTGK